MALAMISMWKRSSRWHVCERQIALRRPPDLLSLPVEQFCWEAFRTDDFEGALATLTVNGFREHAAEDDPMRVMVRRSRDIVLANELQERDLWRVSAFMEMQPWLVL
jgi:hypothetical protein